MDINNRKMISKLLGELDHINKVLEIIDAGASAKVSVNGITGSPSYECAVINGRALNDKIKELIKSEYTNRKEDIIKELEEL